MICAICGKFIESPMFGGEYADVCPECFNTRYWDLIVSEKEKHLVVDGVCYMVGPEPTAAKLNNPITRSWLGCAGREFKYVLLNDLTEEVHVSHNMMVQGPIPKSHRHLLPDTGRFVS